MNVGVVGARSVGKTTLINRLANEPVHILEPPTILTEYRRVLYKDVVITWWDIVHAPPVQMDLLVYVTRDADPSLLEEYPALPTFVANLSHRPVPFCAPWRTFRVCSLSTDGVDELLTCILSYSKSTRTRAKGRRRRRTGSQCARVLF